MFAKELLVISVIIGIFWTPAWVFSGFLIVLLFLTKKKRHCTCALWDIGLRLEHKLPPFGESKFRFGYFETLAKTLGKDVERGYHDGLFFTLEDAKGNPISISVNRIDNGIKAFVSVKRL